MKNKLVSFIIPAYNEEHNIARTLQMIKRHMPASLDYEIILVDHGSTDQTVQIAKQNAALVYLHAKGTVAGLRNYGVCKSKGDVLIFIDADVILTNEWQSKIGRVVSLLREGSRVLTGSWVSVPEQGNWIERYWYAPLQKGQNTHINSGHMIISRNLFEELGGFSAALETGEDYDISMRARENEIDIIDNHELKVIHEGYPRSLLEFIKREYWHGKGDANTIRSIVISKVALIALIFLVMHGAFIATSVLYPDPRLTFIFILFIVFIAFTASFVKYGKETAVVICINAIIYYFYFWARAATLVTAIFQRRVKKRQR